VTLSHFLCVFLERSLTPCGFFWDALSRPARFSRTLKRATIKDVATLSGLSICTVSRALRGLPKISASAKAKVKDAAEKLGYRPSAAAARLRGGRTGAVAIVVPTATTWYFSQAAEAAEEIIADGGLDPMLVSLRGQEQVQSRIFDDPA